MNKKIEKDFVLGGSIEKALSGNYEMSVVAVLLEAWKYTIKNFISFTPSIIVLLIVQLVIFYIAMQLQIGDPLLVLDMFQNPELINQGIFEAIFIANFSYEVISAPIYAGVALMAMSHTAGLLSKPHHILKGLQFTVPVIIATLFSLIIQGVGGMLFPLVSMYLTVAFSNSTLLICEKRVSPIKSLWLSLRAVNKKLIPIIGIYIVLMLMLFFAAIFYGFLLIIVLPFIFHVKGIIYRNMFGVTLRIIASDEQNRRDEGSHSDDGETFEDTNASNDNNSAEDNNDSESNNGSKGKNSSDGNKGSNTFDA